MEAGGDANIYYIEHNTPWPADANISQNSGRRQCMEKTCHCVSEYWLFGDHMKRNQITDPSELEFGLNFRTLAAEFARNGSVPSSVKPYTGNDQWTYLSKNAIETRELYKNVCDLYDKIDLYLKR